jgi:hypothetical protein
MNSNKLVGFLKNKNTVTALAAIVIVIVLVIGYNVRVNQATTPVNIPYARVTIQPGTHIDESMIAYMSVPAATIKGKIEKNRGSIVGKYSKENVIIPAGSLFYSDSLADSVGNTDKELYDKVNEGETLNYITVNMLTSYSNSIVPGNYIDIYAAVQHENRNKIAKLFSNVKVIEVRTSDGKPVFGSSEEARTPYVIFFGLPNEEDMLLKKIHAINSWGGGTQEGEAISTTAIRLTPIPTTAGFDTKDKDEIKLIVTSPKMVKIIDDMARDMTEQTDGEDYNTVNDPIVSGKEENKDKETNTNSGQSSGDGGSELNIDDLLGGNKE